jgi:hypothetical protein
LDLWGAHFAGVTLVVKEDEAFDPLHVRMLRCDRNSV